MSLTFDGSGVPRLRAPSVPARWASRPVIGIETLAVCVSLYFALACNGRFFAGVLAGRDWAESGTWLFGACMLLLLTALHTLLLSLVLHRWIARPLLTLLILMSALSTYYMQRYGVLLDPTMVRNVLHTEPAEAVELLSWGLLLQLVREAVLPIALLWWVQLHRRPIWLAVWIRLGTLLLAGGLVLLAVLLVFQDFSALMRNKKELRYLITPANVMYSMARVLAGDARAANLVRTAVGADARLGPSWAGRTKPALFVIVVGETARAANWGLNGYARQTTPELSQLKVLNFSDVAACGTNTETSLPCMFSAIGRRDYDEGRIRSSESLLHVLAHAGFQVLWRDNQSGCKGVCVGLPKEQLDQLSVPGLCAGGRCFDEILLHGLDTVARDAQGNLVVVLHMLGNHGPAYFKRYPDAFEHFKPACQKDELRQCSRAEIVNAYDNALRYTDRVVAQVIGFLQQLQARFDTAMIYVADHGESLGENGLYLHGIPYAIAPREQLNVPMVWWLSEGFSASFGLDPRCLSAQTTRPWTHDHLFHSVLGLLQVSTQAYEPALDVSAACRS